MRNRFKKAAEFYNSLAGLNFQGLSVILAIEKLGSERLPGIHLVGTKFQRSSWPSQFRNFLLCLPGAN